MPIIPRGFGNSPSIKGDVMSKKTGVRAVIGSVKESGESLIAFTNKIEEIVLSEAVAISASQKLLFTDWKEPKNKTNGKRTKRAKNRCAHAADKMFIFCAPLLFNALETESKNEFKRE